MLRSPCFADEDKRKVRVDTGVREGDSITTFYDPMISKVIVHAENRLDAIDGLYRAL